MASSTVGTAVIKLSFDGSDVKAELAKTSSQFKEAGTKSGSTFGNAMTVAMGSLISKGISKVISSIYNNLDSAINRVDVINNFPKVMESLGFSTDEAASSIKTISSRLDGLPSTLNGVVADVQKLTATMGNLNTGMVNATSLGLALNDMFLAGGKGTEAASNAMEQYNQMLAQGKPDMQSWRSILNAAPGQLKQLAQTLLGATANQQDLYEALQQGNISFGQMNEAIVRLDKEGGKGFASYEKQARSATGGVGTALENVQNRISKAIAKVIETIGSEKIANAINSISSHFEEVGVAVGKFIVDTVRFVSQNMWILEAIKTALVAIIAVNIGNKILEFKKKCETLFESLGRLFGKISAFVAAHPLLAIASALAGLVIGITSVVSHESELTKAINNTKEACDNSVKSWEDLKSSRQSTLDSGMSELKYYDELKDELKGIVDENGKVKAGYEDRAAFIVNKLGDALGIEIKLQDNVISNYQELQTEIDKTIQKKRAELSLKAQEEAYTKALQDRANVAKRIYEIEDEISRIMAGEGGIMRIPELAKSYEEQVNLYSEYATTIKRYEADLAAYTKGSYDDMSQSTWSWVDNIIKSEDVTKEELEKGYRETEINLELTKRLYASTGDEIYKNEMMQYQNKLNLLQNKMGQYNSITSSSLATTRQTWSNSFNQIIATGNSKTAEFNQVGRRGVSSLAAGMSSQSGSVSGALNGVINNAKNAAWGGAWNNGWNLGNRVGASAANGISASSWQAVNQAYSLMDRLRNIVGQSIPGPTIQGFRQSYNFATHSYEYTPMAEGGYVGGATTALIGEAGKEVVLPLQQNTNNWSGLLANAIMEQMDTMEANRPITVYMNNTIDNDMSIDELGRKFSQSIRRYA